jgi:hypothetical protein
MNDDIDEDDSRPAGNTNDDEDENVGVVHDTVVEAGPAKPGKDGEVAGRV